MSEKTTIYDIAKALNITAATVSRALNNNSRISKATRDLVVKKAAEMNYEQNRLALALKSGKSKNVGVVVPYIDRNFFSTVIRGIEEELYPLGYHVIICQTHENEEKEIETISNLLNAQVDGVLMSVSKTTQKTVHFQSVLNKDIPLVFFDRVKEMKGVSTVTIDDYEVAYEATEHLIEQGCKRIAHISGDWKLAIYKHRFKGYKKALEDYGISYNSDYLIKAKSEIGDGQNAIEKLFKLKEIPDAVFCSSDYIALGALQKLKELNVDVPSDFCVVGFSNEPFTQFLELSISSIDQVPRQMGKTAAKVFLEQLENEQGKIEKKVALKATLEKRKSSSRKLQ
ncbi:LacI family DNA-binding transcriptional regulator [Galbibacter mesophilus]|uniref:LacI family DNA-binding transcriptional regulator n=1 Tax=Galbibacter mesophilus TaxID=379069 RepID=UPI00191CE06A|nr:LacI family DNA-binding transcriptional regulator [Galbibacter mesophilus]MCM5663399.1 LacI family transcriptional regulator [Galbibacter mesophilus]